MPIVFFRQAGPNAPLNWVKESVQALSPESNEQRKKVFLGLNFYGMDYSPSGGARKFFVLFQPFLSIS